MLMNRKESLCLRHLVLDVYLDASVLGASCGRVVRRYRMILPERNGGQHARVYPVVREVADDRYGSSRCEVPVGRETRSQRLENPEVVGESLYDDVLALCLLKRWDDLIQGLSALLVELVSALGEEYFVYERNLELILELLYLHLVGGDLRGEGAVELLIYPVQIGEPRSKTFLLLS